MNTLLSVFVTIAMLLSGAGYSANPDAYSSMVTTIGNVVLTINGEEYALNPSVSFGAATENGTALFDVGMTLGEETLFPVQVKLDDAGVSLALGQSTTAYTFSSEMIESALDMGDMPAGFEAYWDSYMRLMNTASSLRTQLPDEAAIQALEDKMTALISTTEEGAATFTIEGTEHQGKLYSFAISNEQLLQLFDVALSTFPEVSDAYLDMINATIAMSGEEIEPLTAFSEFFAMADVEFSAVGTVTADDASAVGTAEVTLNAAGEAFTVPVNFTLYDADTMDMVMPLRFEADGMELAMDVYYMVDGSNVAFTLNMPAIEEGVSFGAAAETTLNEDGSYFSTVDYVINAPEAYVRIYASGTANLDMTGAFTYAAEVSAEGLDAVLSFDVTTEKKAIADRIANASAQEIFNAPEDIENSSGLMLAAMGLMGDVEKLMSDESVAAIVELVNTMVPVMYDEATVAVIGGADGPTSIYVGEEEYEYEDEYWSEGNDDPSMLSFTIPEFGWLPEGYELSEQYVYADASDCAYLYFDYVGSDEGYYSNFSIDLYGNNDNIATSNYAVSADGAVAPITDRVIVVEQAEGEFLSATLLCDGYDVYFSYYGDLLTVDDALNILSNLK